MIHLAGRIHDGTADVALDEGHGLVDLILDVALEIMRIENLDPARLERTGVNDRLGELALRILREEQIGGAGDLGLGLHPLQFDEDFPRIVVLAIDTTALGHGTPHIPPHGFHVQIVLRHTRHKDRVHAAARRAQMALGDLRRSQLTFFRH